MSSEAESLRNERQDERIRAEILQQIRDGHLKPGDRLMTINQIWKRYPVSRHAVIVALQSLARDGILGVRGRAGYFVQPDVDVTRISAPIPASPVSAGAAPAADYAPWQIRQLLAPRRGGIELTLHVPDLYSATLACWQAGLEMFHAQCPGVTVRLLSFRDGALDAELVARERPDVVLTTLNNLDALGAEHFHCGCDIAPSGPSGGAAVRPLAEFAARYPDLAGTPFSLTLEQMFVNNAMAGHVLAFTGQGRTLGETLALLRSLRRNGGATHGIVLSAVHPLFLGEAALVRDAEDRIAYRTNRMDTVLRGIVPGDILVDLHMPERAFLDGAAPVLIQCGFAAGYLRERATFPWTGLPLPFAPAGAVAGFPVVLAVSRGSAHPEACRQLVAFLTATDFQAQYGAVSGTVPAVAAAAFLPGTLAAVSLSEDMLRWSLDRCHLVRQPGFVHHHAHEPMWRRFLAYFAGTMPFDAVMTELRKAALVGEDAAGIANQ